MPNTTEQQQSEKVIAKAQDEIIGQASEPTETAIGDCDRVKEGARPAYYDYIERGKALAGAFKQQERRAEAQDEIIGQASEPTETAIGDCDRVKEGARPAYHTYLDARKGLAEAFKQREPQGQEAYREADQRYQLNKEAIEMAIKVREKAEQDALVAYTEEVDKAVSKASQVYKEAVEMAIKVREEAQNDTLVACTEEVDKTVDKASQVYKDKMKQAWIDCKQRVMDAWKDSMETSVQITGVFEQDRNMNTSPAQPLILNEALVNQLG